MTRKTLVAALSILVFSTAAAAWDRGQAKTFARLPPPTRNPEGIAVDKKTGDVYVSDFDFRGTRNQADEIVVVDPSGKAIAKLGDFDGIGENGAPRGLLFPASLVFHGEFVYVTNLSLDLRLFGFNAVDAQWAAQVRTHTVAKLPS